ncbi:MAG: protein kinase [Planctomycetia bacterium]|jgi:serine/threonine protein kinase|nr:protein kinase [Planctomycetia bacterium]
MHRTTRQAPSFDLPAGRVIGGKYEVVSHIGHGWEGEVYRIIERATGAVRAAKLFHPNRNIRDHAVLFYARKLERLRDCRMVIQYHHVEQLQVRRSPVTALISEYVEGTRLDRLIAASRGGRLSEFEAMAILHELACGLEELHGMGEYHGDLHAQNILVRRRGIRFDLKLVDFYDRGRGDRRHQKDDLVDCARLLREMTGGPRFTAATRSEHLRYLIGGCRSDVISRRFQSAGDLKHHLETFSWPAS